MTQTRPYCKTERKKNCHLSKSEQQLNQKQFVTQVEWILSHRIPFDVKVRRIILLVVGYSHLSGCFLFSLKILGGGRDPWMMVLLENKCSFSDGDNNMWWGHTTRTSFCSDGNFVLSSSGDAKMLGTSPRICGNEPSGGTFTNILEIFCWLLIGFCSHCLVVESVLKEEWFNSTDIGAVFMDYEGTLMIHDQPLLLWERNVCGITLSKETRTWLKSLVSMVTC